MGYKIDAIVEIEYLDTYTISTEHIELHNVKPSNLSDQMKFDSIIENWDNFTLEQFEQFIKTNNGK